eukprot:738624_1
MKSITTNNKIERILSLLLLVQLMTFTWAQGPATCINDVNWKTGGQYAGVKCSTVEKNPGVFCDFFYPYSDDMTGKTVHEACCVCGEYMPSIAPSVEPTQTPSEGPSFISETPSAAPSV